MMLITITKRKDRLSTLLPASSLWVINFLRYYEDLLNNLMPVSSSPIINQSLIAWAKKGLQLAEDDPDCGVDVVSAVIMAMLVCLQLCCCPSLLTSPTLSLSLSLLFF